MVKYSIYSELGKRILVLDGAMGTMVQGYHLDENGYRGERFADWGMPLKGCNDLLALTAPDIISQIHEAYLKAGADIISTDTFNANRISMADYGLEEYVPEINREAVKIARIAADKYTLLNPEKPRFVAGSMGPTNRTASMSADVANPASRGVTFDNLASAYMEQAKGMIEGGVDIFLVETIFDTLNAKAALYAIEKVCEKSGVTIPVMVSGTLTDASGRTLSGQTVEAFYTSLAHAHPISVGLNCAYGAKQMKPYLARLAAVSETYISAHPNAGLPNVMGGYDETPLMMAEDVEQYMKEGLINIIGGCCGTTPVHIAEFAKKARHYSPRKKPQAKHITALSGLERLTVTPQSNFVNVGERTNVAGSAKFARLIREDKYEEALSVAREQVESGAQVVDVCMDDGLIDGVMAMTKFLNLAMSEPEISRVPFMIDSSSWDVLEAGLKCVQGKSIVNSISLKEGEAEFILRAKSIKNYGAAAVVMLFDEKGQADTFERKIEVAKRAYDILTGIEFPPEDIIFDPNILAVATGIEEHDSYGVAFIEACRWIKKNLPYAKLSGGVSNLSFSFRGNNVVREAIHSVFLYHAIAAGMDMGIVNPSMLQIYSDIPDELLELTQDVVLNRRPDATERLAAYAEHIKGDQLDAQIRQADKWRSEPLADRIAYALTKGITDHIDEDIIEAFKEVGTPLGVIDGMLMPAMANVGELFGQGKMFLPQVVKSARVMKKAVGVLTPYIEEGIKNGAEAGKKVLLATVKGDVHDIGKNIVSVVMSCNGYQIEDMGVMIDGDKIVDRAVEVGADVIGLSGLITPSLDEMIKVVCELNRRGASIPVLIGGATTSKLHTAVKIAPNYKDVVIHCTDASDGIKVLSQLFGSNSREYINEVKASQKALNKDYTAKEVKLLSLADARGKRHVKKDVIAPLRKGRIVVNNYHISEIVKFIDWNYFFPAWGLKGRYPDLLNSPDKGEQARVLFNDAQKLLKLIEDENLLKLEAVFGIFPAYRDGDDIIVEDEDRVFKLPQLRNQQADEKINYSLADFVGKKGAGDHICAFAVTAGVGLDELVAKYKADNDDYNAFMSKLLSDRLTEAWAEALHSYIRKDFWGFQSEESSARDAINGKYQGRRVAFGYPSCPDHSIKKEIFELLKLDFYTTMTLTENFMIKPGETVCGLIFADSDIPNFSVGIIDDVQLEDYALRRGVSKDEIKKLIPNNKK